MDRHSAGLKSKNEQVSARIGGMENQSARVFRLLVYRQGG